MILPRGGANISWGGYKKAGERKMWTVEGRKFRRKCTGMRKKFEKVE